MKITDIDDYDVDAFVKIVSQIPIGETYIGEEIKIKRLDITLFDVRINLKENNSENVNRILFDNL